MTDTLQSCTESAPPTNAQLVAEILFGLPREPETADLELAAKHIAALDLLPCPFCGSTNIDPAGWSGVDEKSGPGCEDCGALADSAELWNRRAALARRATAPHAAIEQDFSHVMTPFAPPASQHEADATAALHAAIMNIPVSDKVKAELEGAPKGFYLLGHRDARHAAAELASELASRGRAQGGNTSEEGDFANTSRAELIRYIDFLRGTIESSESAAAPADLSQAARDVLAERRRQVEQEGWTPAHDDKYDGGELSFAAVCYATYGDCTGPERVPNDWPWDGGWWKPADDRRNLVKAGALILADIERLDRATRPAGDAEQDQPTNQAEGM